MRYLLGIGDNDLIDSSGNLGSVDKFLYDQIVMSLMCLCLLYRQRKCSITMTAIKSCARACVVHENKLLLVSNDGSYWYLPGGHMELRESLSACAKREVYEETGYAVIIQDILYVSEFYDKKLTSHKVESIFRAVVDKHPHTVEWEDHDSSVTMKRWFSLEEMQARSDIQPPFLKEGKWLQETGDRVYQGYDESK